MNRRFVTLPEIRKAARARLPRDVWNFGAGGAETETTLRRNRRALDGLAIAQSVLTDVREIDLRTSLLGVPLSWPVAVAPMGGLVLFDGEGDVAMARGCGAANTLQFLSGAAGWSVEDVAAAGAAPKMFQLYHHGDRAWVADLLARVEAAGYLAVCLTVDVQVLGRRERDILNRYDPREAMRIAPSPRGPDPTWQARLTWDDVDLPHTAATAIAQLEEGQTLLRADLDALADDAALDEMRLTNWGDRWPTWRIFWTMIFHDLHHGAEIGCLRDLYLGYQPSAVSRQL